MDSLEQQLADALEEGTFDYSRISPAFMTCFLAGYFQHQHEIRNSLRADLRNVCQQSAEQLETIHLLRGGDREH